MPNIYVSREGQTYGPYDEEIAKSYVRSGQLRVGDLACWEGAEDWQNLGFLLGIAPPPPPVASKPRARLLRRAEPKPSTIQPEKRKTHPLVMLAAIIGIPFALLWGCYHIGSGVIEGKSVSRAAEQEREKASLYERTEKAVSENKVFVGMAARDAVRSWGEPKRKNRTTTAYGQSEQWVYAGGNYLYFKNGVLESISN